MTVYRFDVFCSTHTYGDTYRGRVFVEGEIPQPGIASDEQTAAYQVAAIAAKAEWPDHAGPLDLNVDGKEPSANPGEGSKHWPHSNNPGPISPQAEALMGNFRVIRLEDAREMRGDSRC